MGLRPAQRVGLVAVIVFGGILVRLLWKPKPKVIHLPSVPMIEPRLPPVIDTAELERQRAAAEQALEAIRHPPPTPEGAAPPPDAPPPPPRVRLSARGAGAGKPIPWPAEPPEPYRPEVMRAYLDRAIKECGMGELEVVTLECDDFPCMALTIARDEPARQSNLNSCGVWNEVYGGTQYLEQTVAGVVYRTWVPLAPHPDDARIVMARSQARSRRLVKAHAR